MRIRIKSEDMDFNVAVPFKAAPAAVRMVPDKMFDKIRKAVPEPFGDMVSRENALKLLKECGPMLKEYKGLEIIHIESKNGTFVSVDL